MSAILSGFFRGLIIVGPIGITVYVVYSVVTYIDGLLDVGVPGLGLLLTLVLITLVGLFASNVIGRRIVEWLERGVARVPIVKLLYASIKDLLGAFIDNRRRFRFPVMVDLLPEQQLPEQQLPEQVGAGNVNESNSTSGAIGQHIKLIGFVTREKIHVPNLEDQVAVYVPQCYNLGGVLLVVPRKSVTRLEADAAQTMAFVVSGGLSGLKDPREPTTTGVTPQDGELQGLSS